MVLLLSDKEIHSKEVPLLLLGNTINIFSQQENFSTVREEKSYYWIRVKSDCVMYHRQSAEGLQRQESFSQSQADTTQVKDPDSICHTQIILKSPW